MKAPRKSTSIAAAIALALAAGGAAGQMNRPAPATNPPAYPSTSAKTDQRAGDEARDAVEHVNKALAVVRKMEADPKVNSLLKQAKGVFIVPDYGRAALGVGGQGGAGVLLVHESGKWSGPGFYNFGGASIGAQAGVSAGQISMILMDDKALDSFARNNKFSLNADAGLTIVNYSARAHGTAGRGDIVLWSDTEGAFANVSVSVTDVNYDENETHAYYGKPVSAHDIVSGRESASKAASLVSALPA